MAGLCGIVGSQRGAITDLANALNTFGDQRESLFHDDLLELGYVDHAVEFEKQPATTENVSIWCWGDILGHEYQGQYTPRPGNLSDAEYCATLYETYGLNFIAGLNSEFSGVIYDYESETVSIFTDRLGTRPIYYTRTPDGSIAFSSLLPSLSAYPEVNLEVDPEFLSELFTFSSVFGVYTPVEEVQEVPPASVLTFSTEGSCVNDWRYWWPVPTERKGSFSEYADQFGQEFQNAVHERVDQHHEQGLLLSGGADSRLLLEVVKGDITSFHMNETLEENSEAQTAKEVAEVTGSSFRFLNRDQNYYPDCLHNLNQVNNLNNIFHHAHAVGFADELSNEVGSVFCGHYSDTILSDTYVPMEVPVSPAFRHLYPLSQPKSITNSGQYVKAIKNGEIGDYNTPVPYLADRISSTDTLDSNIKEISQQIRFQGVPFPSWSSLIQFGMIYPITNTRTHVFYNSLNQMLPAKYPFLDNRIVDLALQMPTSYRYKRDIVETALSERNPELASISHPSHGLPLHCPYYIKHYVGKATVLLDKIERTLSSGGTEDSIGGGGGSWPNHATLIRQHSFVGDMLEKNEARIRASPYLDYDAAQECYAAHRNGENYTQQLYALITVLESSLDLDNE